MGSAAKSSHLRYKKTEKSLVPNPAVNEMTFPYCLGHPAKQLASVVKVNCETVAASEKGRVTARPDSVITVITFCVTQCLRPRWFFEENYRNN